MRLLLFAITVAACSRTPSTESKRVETADPCSPAALKLPAAKPVVAWNLPEGCTARTQERALLVKTQADAATAFECKGTPLGVDFTKQALVVAQRTLSPATVGLLALDDGKTITLVSKARNPCPNDPQPMPVPATFVFLVELGDRAFAEASCTIQPSC